MLHPNSISPVTSKMFAMLSETDRELEVLDGHQFLETPFDKKRANVEMCQVYTCQARLITDSSVNTLLEKSAIAHCHSSDDTSCRDNSHQQCEDKGCRRCACQVFHGEPGVVRQPLKRNDLQRTLQKYSICRTRGCDTHLAVGRILFNPTFSAVPVHSGRKRPFLTLGTAQGTR